MTDTRRFSVVFLGALATTLVPAAAQDWYRAPRFLGTPPNQPLADIGYRLGDVDGDGDLDRIEVGAQGVAVQLNDGEGDFGPIALTADSVPVGSVSRAVLADLDGDGDLDVVARGSESQLVAFFWDAGASAYAAPIVAAAYPTPWPTPQYTHLVAGDLDGDGDDEIVSAEQNSFIDWTLTAWHWNGAALVPGPAQTFAPPLNTFGSPLVAGDVTGDGADDVVALVVDALKPRAWIFASAGGQLQAPQQVTLGAFTSAELHLADREGDGDLDLLSASVGPAGQGSALQWLRNNGTGGFQLTPATFFPDIAQLVVAAGDWDGDGDGDAVGPEGLFENLGGTSFAAPRENPVKSEPLAVADLTGDGRADYFAGGRLLVGDQSFDVVADAYLDHVSDAIDVDRDGDLDLFSPGFSAAIADGDFEFLPNDGAAGFGAPTEPTLADLAPTEQLTGCVGPADFDGDGLLELVCDVAATPHPFIPAVFVRRVLLRETAPGVWSEDPAATATAPLPLRPGPSGVIDIDGDGALDLVDSVPGDFQQHTAFWSPGDGLGGFGPAQPIEQMRLVDVGDVDGDGLPELIGAENSSLISVDQLLVRNLGGGSFATEIVFDAVSSNFADVDGDGDRDLVGWRYVVGGPQEIVGRINNGSGFGPVQLFATASLCVGTEFSAGDVTGDGTVDLVSSLVSFSHTGRLAVHAGVPGSDPPVFESERCFDLPFAALFADLDSDGDLDVAGQRLYLGRAVEGPTAPSVLQYGAGAAGSGGWTPLLGSSGVPAAGATVTTRLVDVPGGATVFYFYGTAEAFVPDFPAPGLTVWVGGLFAPIAFVATGAPGAAGGGGFEFAYPVLPGFVGLELFKQALVVDAAGPAGLTLSNAVRVRYGL